MFITTYSGQLGHLHLVVYIQIILKVCKISALKVLAFAVFKVILHWVFDNGMYFYTENILYSYMVLISFKVFY
jgi:hypothetical protein